MSSIPPPPIPDRWIAGKYELLEIAGKGGMAVVWRARHHGPGSFQRTVAVKQMHLRLTRDKMYRDLFCEEARVGSVLQDPNIAQIFDFVEDDGQYYLVMEYVNGVDLATLIHWVVHQRQRKTQWEVVAAIGVGILRALVAAHERRTDDGTLDPIVHRDLSPTNVLINDKGMAKLIDFGLSFARDRDIAATDPGVAKGKLAYLAPEIARGRRPSPASDQFTVGSVLWEALTGQRAFEGDTDFDTYQHVANAVVRPLSELRPDIPPELCRLVHKALAVDPTERFASTREMARELGNVLEKRRTSEDLYSAIARTVLATRQGLDIGERTQDPNIDEEVDDERSGMVELLVEGNDPPRGFAKWLPSFMRKNEVTERDSKV